MEKKEYKKMRWEDPKLHQLDRANSTLGLGIALCEPGSSAQGCADGAAAAVVCAVGAGKGIIPPG